MAKSINDIEKKRGRGRPPTDSTPVLVRLQPNDLAALDAYRSDFEPMTRPQAIRSAAFEWLRTHGYAPALGKKPAGPATKVVDKMDVAIAKDRSRPKREK